MNAKISLKKKHYFINFDILITNVEKSNSKTKPLDNTC